MEDSNVRHLATANSDFGLKLWNKLASGKRENVFISPFSIASALALASVGATTTAPQPTSFWTRFLTPTTSVRDEMRKVLRHEVMGHTEESMVGAETAYIDDLAHVEDIELLVANSAWTKGDVSKEYLELVQNAFNAEVEPLTTPEAVNSWCNEKTKGHIDTLVETIPPDAVMLLLNAIYFKGAWTYQFDKELTIDAAFKNSSGEEKTVAMMMMAMNEFEYFEVARNFQMIKLPYGKKQEDGNRFAAYVFLPDRSSTMDKFISSLDINNWHKWRSQTRVCEGTLHMPRIKIEYGARSLCPELKAMGMKTAFEHGNQFDRIAPGVRISDVLHKAVIDLDEEGTTAAAVTSSEMRLESARVPPPKRFEMRVDRPFVLVISDETTEHILFVGRVENPQ